jgi:uncharacterized membrane protein
MLIYQMLFGLFALSTPTIGLIVMLRLLWSAYQALRASRIKLAALSILAFVCLVALSVVVAAVWFGYAVAHSKKDIWSDLTVILLTGLPFYVVSYTLWRMAKRFQSALSVEAAQPDVSADAPQVVRR